jgi:hypothetical protein
MLFSSTTLDDGMQMALVKAGKAGEVVRYCNPENWRVQLAVVKKGFGQLLVETLKPDNFDVHMELIEGNKGWLVAKYCKPSPVVQIHLIRKGQGWTVEKFCKINNDYARKAFDEEKEKENLGNPLSDEDMQKVKFESEIKSVSKLKKWADANIKKEDIKEVSF